MKQFLSQGDPGTVKAPANLILPCDKKFAIAKVHSLRMRLVNSQAYTKAFHTHCQGGTTDAINRRRSDFLSQECKRRTTSIFGGDVEISAYALTRNFVCRVWELQGDTIRPNEEKFACTTSATRGAHFLFSRTPNPEQRGEFLRNGHFDLLLPEEIVPQGLGSLQKFCPPNHPPLFRVPCPGNGHCLFFAMSFLDDLMTPTIVDADADAISEDERHIVDSSPSGSSSESSYN
jgi:hypothetical protein